MLQNVPKILTPELYKILYNMGHGDRIVIADANFPADANAKRLCIMTGLNACDTLDLVLNYIPVDTFIPYPVTYMSVADGDDYHPDIWGEFNSIFLKQKTDLSKIQYVSRSEFYQQTQDAYAVLLTDEMRRYGNVIISKGVISSF